MNVFKKKKYISLNIESKTSEAELHVPNGLWLKCPDCKKAVYKEEIGDLKICPNCKYPFRLGAVERLNLICDEHEQIFDNIFSTNPMNYPKYEEKLNALKEATDLDEAVVCTKAKINGVISVVCVMDTNFIMGSMGSVVGEKLALAFEFATQEKLPIIIFTASGGARMQEGILSLMQMAKLSAAAKRHSEAGLLYVTVITDPTTGGVTASFAMLGDIIIAEPKATIGFTGRRVIEQTIKQTLPDDFQTAEFMLEHGFIDKIVERDNLKQTLYLILKMHNTAELS